MGRKQSQGPQGKEETILKSKREKRRWDGTHKERERIGEGIREMSLIEIDTEGDD